MGNVALYKMAVGLMEIAVVGIVLMGMTLAMNEGVSENGIFLNNFKGNSNIVDNFIGNCVSMNMVAGN